MLESYATTMTTAADRMVELLKGPALKGESVNISEAGARLTMDVIGNTAFGVDFDAQRDEKDKPSELFRTAKAVFEPIGVCLYNMETTIISSLCLYVYNILIYCLLYIQMLLDLGESSLCCVLQFRHLLFLC